MSQLWPVNSALAALILYVMLLYYVVLYVTIPYYYFSLTLL